VCQGPTCQPGESLSAVDRAAAGSAHTAQGEELTSTTEADGSININGGSATPTCSDVTTQNATGHVIDTVLLPTPPDRHLLICSAEAASTFNRRGDRRSRSRCAD
jgi:hypothetical protein